MAVVTWSLKARDRRILGRGALPALCVSLAFLHLYVVLSPSVSDAADRPASPAQLQGLRDQIAGLRGQQQARVADLNQASQDIASIQGKIAQIDAIDGLWGPAKDVAIAAYMLAPKSQSLPSSPLP